MHLLTEAAPVVQDGHYQQWFYGLVASLFAGAAGFFKVVIWPACKRLIDASVRSHDTVSETMPKLAENTADIKREVREIHDEVVKKKHASEG